MFVKIRNIIINTFLSRRNVCLFLEHKNLHFGIQWTLGKHFLSPAIVEAFSLQKVVEMLEEVVVSWQEVRWIWWMRQNFLDQLFQLLKHWLYNVRLLVVRENWTHSVHQYWLQVLQFSENLIDLLNILLRYNGFCQDSEICCGSDLQQTTKQRKRESPSHYYCAE